MELREHAKSDKIKWIIAFVLIAIIGLGLIGLAVSINQKETIKRIGIEAYSIGTLNETGEFVESEEGLCTKGLYTVDGLTITVDDDASVTYKLYFFGAEETFISSTSALSTDFDGELPEGAKYFKIAITPANDTKVEWFEINGYVSQLSVVVNK